MNTRSTIASAASEVCTTTTMKSISTFANASTYARAMAMRRFSSSSFLSSSRLAIAERCFAPVNSQVSSSYNSSRSVRVSSMASDYEVRPPRRNYRREPRPSISELDLEEEVAKIDMDPAKMMTPDHPLAVAATIKEVMPVGYFCQLATGRIGYLPAQDLGFTGGLAILQRLFKEGQEITVRIVCRGGAGREIVSIKKPEFAPPSEQKTIESMRLHFENEKKNMGRPRRR